MANDDGAVDTKHPEWNDRIDEWRMMRSTIRGEKRIKEDGQTWLPMPAGFAKQKDKGLRLYNSYRTRAQFPEFVAPTVNGLTGIICHAEIEIDLPTAMEPLWEKATADGLTLEAFYSMIVAEVMATGRYGILAEASKEGSDIPWLAGYVAESIINWSEDRSFFVLDESGLQRSGFAWTEGRAYRVLELEDGRYRQREVTGDNEAETPIDPTRRGGDSMMEIPFVVVGAVNNEVKPGEIPLIQVARSAVAIYQLSADYRFQLYQTGQETLFIFNADAPDAVGAGVVISIKAKSKEDHPPKAEYVGPKGIGIEKHRQAILDEREVAAQAGAKLFDTESAVQESGEAKKIRYAAQTATLTTISQSTAKGLEKALRHIAVMMGQDPEAVVVHPNLQFLESALSPTEAKALVDMWVSRAISYETLYGNLQRGEIASKDRTAEEELELIDEEAVDDPRETGILPRNPQNGIVPPDPNGPPQPEI
jgi:hypothetical protein